MPQMEVIKSKILKSIDILKLENFTSEDNYLILFLLVFYNKRFDPNGITSKYQLLQIIKGPAYYLSNENSSHYFKICGYFEYQIEKLSEEGFKQLLSVLSEIDRIELKNNFEEIYDHFLQLITLSQGRFSDETLLPNELIQLMWNLAEPSPKAKIFNPFARLACFGVSLPVYQNYYGQEENLKTWALGFLRFLAYGKTDFDNYKQENSLLSWPDSSKKFDYVISVPPLGMRLGNQHQEIEPDFRTIEQFLVEKSLRSLNPTGKLIALFSQSFLTSGSHNYRLRERLVEEDLIETIISLPGGILPNTNISTVIVVLSKAKKHTNKVQFVDASKHITSKGPREKVLSNISLINLIHSNNSDNNVIRIVDNEQIRNNDFNLSVARYFKKQIDGIKLGELLQNVRGQRINIRETGKLVRIRDLKDDNLDFKLDISSVPTTELARPDFLVKESCLLLAVRWRNLKPTYFEYNGISIIRNLDILSFKVDASKVDLAYLINELHSEYVQEQLDSYRLSSSVIPYIRKNDLMEVVIKLPSLEIQRAKVQGIYELSHKIKNLQVERSALANDVTNKLYESVSTIRHSLGKPLLNIGSSLRNIEKALTKFNSEWKEVKLNERYNLTIMDSFDSIYSNLELINSMLRNNETVLEVSNYKLTEIDFIAFINRYINQIKSAERTNVITKLDINPEIKTQLKNKVLINANSELLEIGLNAIVENANMHAFTNDSRNYIIEFKVSLYVASNLKNQIDYNTIGRFDSFLRVEVSNNGMPFPKNYSLEKLIRKNSFAGETGNTGQGGFDLNEIIKYHNNGVSTLKLITDDYTSEFSTTYSFLIPLNS